MKILLAIAMGAVMIIGGTYAANGGDQIKASAQKVIAPPSNQQSEHVNEVTADVSKLPEYKTLAGKIDLSKYSLRIVEDNSNKRVIILKDGSSRDQYKSIFVKKDSRLKIVDYQGGLIFNDIIAGNTDENAQVQPSVSDTIAQLPEYKKLAATVDLLGYSVQVVEDNRNKRILLFKDEKGNNQVKTIYVKKTGFMKVINL